MAQRKATKRKIVKPRVPRTRGGGTMTEAAYWSFLRSGLRSKSQRWPPRFKALNDARRFVKGKRHKWEYLCAECHKWHKQKEVEVDHIVPCGTLKAYSDLPGFVERLFCEGDGLRIVCKPCHKRITAIAKAPPKKEKKTTHKEKS
jgi:hypothetical protein